MAFSRVGRLRDDGYTSDGGGEWNEGQVAGVVLGTGGLTHSGCRDIRAWHRFRRDRISMHRVRRRRGHLGRRVVATCDRSLPPNHSALIFRIEPRNRPPACSGRRWPPAVADCRLRTDASVCDRYRTNLLRGNSSIGDPDRFVMTGCSRSAFESVPGKLSSGGYVTMFVDRCRHERRRGFNSSAAGRNGRFHPAYLQFLVAGEESPLELAKS